MLPGAAAFSPPVATLTSLGSTWAEATGAAGDGRGRSSSPSFGRSPARLEDEVRPVWGVVGLSATRSCRGGTSSCLRRRFTPTGTARRAQCFSRYWSCWRSHLPSSDLDARSLRLSLRGGLRLRSRVAFRLNCDTVWHGFATESPRHPVDTVAESLDHRPERRPSAVRRSDADRKEPCMLLQLHLRLPALAALLLLVLIAVG